MTFVARSITTDKRFYGVEEAIVTSVEHDKSEEGRVKVKLVRHEMELECRLCNPYAGNGYGFFFAPEEKDEVLVAFIQGDMRYPVILGGLYNGKDKPPTFRAKDRNQKMIRTRGKHEILMDDTSGKERVRIKTQSGHEADLSDEEKKVTIKTANGQSMELDGQGNKMTITTSGGQSITLDGNTSTITLSGPMTVTLDATSINLGSAATQPLVLGTAFMALFNAHVHTPGLPVTSPPVTPMTPAMLSLVTKTT